MKFTVSSASLLTHLQTISRVINSKNTLPILDNFLFNLHDGVLTITAADMETTLVTTMELDSSEGSGVVALSSKILLDTLKEFSDEPLTFNIDDTNFAMVIKSVSGTYNFNGLNADEYPQVKSLEAGHNTLTIPANVLSMGVTSTSFATSDDEIRPIMCGIYFDINPESVTFVASDGHKLVRIKTVAAKGDSECSFILPKKPVSLLKSILPKESGDVRVEFDTNFVHFTLSNYQMICRQTEGVYPKYNSVIPENNPNKATVDRVSLLNVLRRISVYANQSTNLVKMEFSEGKITVSAQDFDFSTSAVESVACSYEGSFMKIGFKCAIIIDMLNNISSENVIIEMSDSSRAGLILPLEQSETEDVLMLSMPMMLPE